MRAIATLLVSVLALLGSSRASGEDPKCDAPAQIKLYSEVLALDQAPRRKLSDRLAQPDFRALPAAEREAQLRELFAEVRRQDAEARSVLLSHWQQCGKPQPGLHYSIGLDATVAVAIHADLEFQQAVSSVIREGVRLGVVSSGAYGAFEARLQKNLDRKREAEGPSSLNGNGAPSGGGT